MTERQQVESSTAWRPPPRMSGGRRLTGGKAVREAAGLMQIMQSLNTNILQICFLTSIQYSHFCKD